MEQLILLALSTFLLLCTAEPESKAAETILSTVLTPDSKEKTLNRQGRSYYDPRYGPRPLYDRLQYARLDYDRPGRSGCGRCYDERYEDDRDGDRDYDRGRDRYDDARRVNHRPTYGNRFDKNKNDNDRDDDDRRYSTDRSNNNKNGTNDESGNDKKGPHNDNDDRDRGSSRNKHRNRDRDRDRYDDRDRYRPDYYDRFLTRDPYRDRPYDRERPYQDDLYRRPLYERYDDPYSGFGGRHDGYGYPGYRRPAAYDDRYDRGNGYDDVYGGYGPGVGRGPHDSFRPWDETYRGQAGWDAGGRGYYFASGRPEPAPAPAPAPPAWQRPDYTRPAAPESGWQNTAGGSYAGGYRDYRDPLEYRGSLGYGQSGYRQDVSAGYGNGYSIGGPQASQGSVGYGQGSSQGYVPATGYPQSGWHSVGERVRPYRDQSGVNQIDDRDRDYRYPSRDRERDRYPQAGNRQPASGYSPNNAYGQNSNAYGQNTNAYGQNSNAYGQNNNGGYGQTQQSTSYSSSSTTPQTSYLYQRDEEQITKIEETTQGS